MYVRKIPIDLQCRPIRERLNFGFEPGSSLSMEVYIGETCSSFAVNLQLGPVDGPGNDIALHFNPRLDQSKIVLNSLQNDTWHAEEIQPLVVMMDDGSAVRAFSPRKMVHVKFSASDDKFVVTVNGVRFASFKYRVRPELVSHFKVSTMCFGYKSTFFRVA